MRIAVLLTLFASHATAMQDVCRLGADAFQRRDFAAAETALAKCTTTPAATLDSFLMLAGVYQLQANAEALHRTALAGIRRFPAEPRFYLTAANHAGRAGDFAQAQQTLEPAAKRWPDDAKIRALLQSALLGRGKQLLDAGNNAEAEKHLRRAVALDPADVEAQLNLGRALHNLFRGTEAVKVFNALLAANPNAPLAHFHRGLAFHALGDFARAIADMDAELTRNAGYPPALLTRGMARLAEGVPQDALVDLNAAATAMPNDAKVHAARATALSQLGRSEEANAAWRKAAELDPKESAHRNALLARRATLPSASPAPTAAAAFPQFEDVALKAGVTIRAISGAPNSKPYLVESVGGGIAALDYNNDGWMDLYVVNGSTIAATRAGATTTRSALYRNNRDGTFTDVTLTAGVPNKGWGKGVLAADLNNDGHVDVYLTNFGPNVLYINNGNGTFRDATAKAGVGDPRWSSAAAAADFDKDGDLDIFVANYAAYDINKLPTAGQFCSYQGIKVACGPRGLPGAGDALYRNNGDGTFTDVAKQAGVDDPKGYFGLGAAWGDYDNDGDPDLFVANDSTPNLLYRNNGDGTFTDVAVEAGVAYSDDGREQAGMGVELEDLDNDGLLDIMVTNFSDDYNTLYRNSGDGTFRDISHSAGLVADSWRDLSWGVGFFDFDNDGRKDVFVANGHIYPEVDRMAIQVTYRQANKLYQNIGRTQLKPAPLPAVKKSYRGAAFADFNNDGWMDVAVAAIDDPPALLINRGVPGRHWLAMRLEGQAVGARVSVTAGGVTQTRDVKAGGSFASTNDPRQHFGLGESTVIDELKIKWPSGRVTRRTAMEADRLITLRESESDAR